MNITVMTTYDLEAYKALNSYMAFRGKKPSSRIVMLIISFCVIAPLFVYIALHDRQMLPSCLFMAVLFALICLLFFFMAYALPRIQYKNASRFGIADITYTFTEDTLSAAAQSQSESYASSSDIKYAAFHKAAETDSYLFLYQTPGQVMIVDKSGLSGEDTEAIASRLKFYLGRKYRRVYVK